MKFCTIVFVALATVFLCTEYIHAAEICPQENCLNPYKCSQEVKSQPTCLEHGTSCCSVVKKEYQTHCRHYGGECMKMCATQMQRKVVDCENDSVCCVLV